MPQLTYDLNPGGALPGMVFGSGAMDVISKSNSTNQLDHVLVVNAVNAAVYELHFVFSDGETADVSYTADGSATKTEIRDGLIAAIAAEATASLYVEGAVVDSDEFTVERLSEKEGVSFVMTSTGDTPSDLTISTLVDDSVGIPFGVMVCLDEKRGDAYCRLPRASGDVGNKTFGVAICKTARQPNANGYVSQNTVSILSKGKIWVTCEDAFSYGDDVYVRHTASGSNTQLGAVRTDADTANATALSRAKFISSGSAGDVALIELS